MCAACSRTAAAAPSRGDTLPLERPAGVCFAVRCCDRLTCCRHHPSRCRPRNAGIAAIRDIVPVRSQCIMALVFSVSVSAGVGIGIGVSQVFQQGSATAAWVLVRSLAHPRAFVAARLGCALPGSSTAPQDD